MNRAGHSAVEKVGLVYLFGEVGGLCLSGSWEAGEWTLLQSLTTQFLIPPESTWASESGVQAADSSIAPELGRLGPQVDRRFLTIAFSKVDAIWEGILDPRKMMSVGIWEQDSSQGPLSSLLLATLPLLGTGWVVVNEILCANTIRGCLGFYQTLISP